MSQSNVNAHMNGLDAFSCHSHDTSPHILVFGGWDSEGQHKDAAVCNILNTTTWEWRRVSPDGEPP